MRIVGSKASYETTSSIAEKLMEISKMEGTDLSYPHIV